MEGLTQALMLSGLGIGLGIGAAFTGLGGGFLMIPLLLFMGSNAQKAVGASFLKKIFAAVLVALAIYLFMKK